MRTLGLPTEEEVKLLLDILKAFPDPRRMPEFMKRRGRHSRRLTIMDFVKPVRTAEEKALLMELFQPYTKNKHTDWLGLCRDFNLRVVMIWEETKTLSNLYLKCEDHLQLYEKEFTSQASQAEVAHATSVINGLPASASAYCQAPLQPPQPGQGLKRGQNRGGAGGTRKCARYFQALSKTVPQTGH